MPLPPENPEYVPQPNWFTEKDIEKAINDLWENIGEDVDYFALEVVVLADIQAV